MPGPTPPGCLQRTLEVVGAASLLVLMVVVFIDVMGRNLLNRPLPWGTELLEVVLGLMIFALYPLLALRSTHITVDLVPVPAPLRAPQRLLSALVGAVLFGVIAYCTGRQAIRSAGYGDASAILQIPTSWVLWGMCALSVATVGAFVFSVWRSSPAPQSLHGVVLE
jgi:TRAP-type C4-dicarboxylate transport system permease small subunit